MSRHNALCHDSGVRCCVANKVGCASDIGFLCATELAMTESSAAYNKAGRSKAGVHGNVTSCYVATKEVRRARQTRSGVHDMPWASTIEVCAQQGNYVAIERTLSRHRAEAARNFMSR